MSKTLFVLIPIVKAGMLLGQNVGINNSNPNFPLTITASNTGNQLISLRNGNNLQAWHLNLMNGGNDLNFAESDVADYRLYLKKGGRIGINTNNPSATLSISGSGNQGIDLLVNGRIRTGDVSNNGGIWLSQGNNLFLGMASSSNLGGFWASGTGWNTFNLNALTGNIGVGGSPDPLNKFTVYGASLFLQQLTIGTNAQLASLQVNGDIIATGEMTIGPSFVTTFYERTAEEGITRYTFGCPSGYRVVSGGGGHRDFNLAADDIQINYSGPEYINPNTNWQIFLTNVNSSSRAVRLFITCAKNN